MLQVVCVLVLAVQFALAADADVPRVALSQDGRALLPIVVVDADGQLQRYPHMKATLADLADCLKQMTGGTFEMKQIGQLPQSPEPGVYVGLAAALAPLGVPADLAAQESLVRSTADGKLLVSGGGDARGVLQAVYALLHELGCRWYYPGDMWAVIPQQRDLSVAVDLRVMPDFPVNRRMWIGHGMRSPVIRTDFTDWQRRNRIAEPFGVQTRHTWFGLDKPAERKAAFAEHPEWFGLDEGERKSRKPCYSHPEVIQRGKEYAVQYFRDHPDETMVSLSPPDGGDYCTCELCRQRAGVVGEVFLKHNQTPFGHNARGELVSLPSETVYAFVNEVARHLQQHYPDKQIGVLAYTTYAHPPTFALESNVYVELTTAYRFTPLTMPEQLTAFGRLAKHVGIYGYLDVEQWSWERPGKGAAKLDRLQESMRLYHQAGVRGYSAEMSNNFAPMGVGYYVATRLLWDTQQDARQIELQFYRDAFGEAAAPAIERVYRRWESGQGMDDASLVETLRDLAESAQVTRGQPHYRDCVDRLRMYAHFQAIYLKPELTAEKKQTSVDRWKQQFGEVQARQRMSDLGEWTRRLMNTHMIHSYAFNQHLTPQAQLLGCDTSSWLEPGDIPTHDEIEQLFAEDLARLSVTGATAAP